MTDKVVDASAICAILFDEPRHDDMVRRLHASTLYAPLLLDFEIANVCLKKIRAQSAQRADIFRMYGTMKVFSITKIDIDLSDAIILAERLNLSLYDASYLWLARHLGAELVTLDQKLERAAATI